MGAYANVFTSAMQVMEDPFDGSWNLLSLMFLKAAQGGGRAVLDGLDGDIAVGATTNYPTQLLRKGQWRKAWNEVKGFSRHYYRGQVSAPMLFVRALRPLFVTNNIRRLKRRFWIARHYRSLLMGTLVSRQLADRVDLRERMEEYYCSLSPAGVAPHASSQHNIQVAYLTVAIERYERLSSYFGVEARHPLLDKRLLEISSAMPLQQKVRDGWSKFLLRRLAANRLPDSVAWREGHEQLGWGFTDSYVRNPELQLGFHSDKVPDNIAPYIDDRSWRERLSKGVPQGSTEHVADIWSCYCLHKWLR